MVEIDYCTRCGLRGPEEARLLGDLVRSKGRTVEDIRRQLYKYSFIEEKAKEQLEKRLHKRQEDIEDYKLRLKEYEEKLFSAALDRLLQDEDIEIIAERMRVNKGRQEMEQAINKLRYETEDIDCRDIEAVLKDYEFRGHISMQGERIEITSKGARVLARQALGEILSNLANKNADIDHFMETGYGLEISSYSRKYESGDTYELIDIEKTLLNSLERSKGKRQSRFDQGIRLKIDDFYIFDTYHLPRMCAGILIDESGSMQMDGKLGAAVSASLALAELIRREPRDSLKIFTFSSVARSVKPWDIVNTVAGWGSTDLKAGMRAFRISAMMEKCHKQAYLITDAEPNTEDGKYIGFEKAMEGIVQESLRYRKEGIILNIIMLDQSPSLKKFARIIAKKNLGRVFFTHPDDLGAVIIEDFLKVRYKNY